MLAVIVTIMTITGDIYVVLIVIMKITGRSICSANSYCENNDKTGGRLYVVITVIVTITGIRYHNKLLNTTPIPPTIIIEYLKRTQFHPQSLPNTVHAHNCTDNHY